MFKLDNSKVPNGTVLLMGIQYENQTSAKIWTYALLKAGGLWYVTGNGKVPVAAGWEAINRWLAKDGRVVKSVVVATGWAVLYTVPAEDDSSPVDTSQASG
jgi:hypothetical protein